MKMFSLCFAAVLLTSYAHSKNLTKKEAKKLYQRSGCVACHSVTKDKIGPAFLKIAARYQSPDEATRSYLGTSSPLEYLTKKVRQGTMAKGKRKNKNWIKNAKGKNYGVMTANRKSRISDSQLEALLKWILALPVRK